MHSWFATASPRRDAMVLGALAALVVAAAPGCDVCKDRKDTRLDVGPDSVLLDWADLSTTGGMTTALLVASVWREVPDANTEIVITECSLAFTSSDPSWLLLIPEDILLRYLNPEADNWNEAAEAAYQDWQAGTIEMDPGYFETVSDERGMVPVLAYLRCPPVDCGQGEQDACDLAAASGGAEQSNPADDCTVAGGTVTVTFGEQQQTVVFTPT